MDWSIPFLSNDSPTVDPGTGGEFFGPTPPSSSLSSGFSYGVLTSDVATSNIPYLDTPIFSPAVMAPDGVQLIDQRSNTSFLNIFDQSKISSSVSNVIGSVIQAGLKSGAQVGADALNKQSNQNNALGQFARNFRSTATGAQLNAAAIGTQFQNFIANPIVWFAAVAGIIAIIAFRK